MTLVILANEEVVFVFLQMIRSCLSEKMKSHAFYMLAESIYFISFLLIESFLKMF